MITDIAKTPFYSLAVDVTKNRIYFSIWGYWKSAQDVPNYLDDMRKAIKQVRSGFNLIADLTQMTAAPQEIKKLHEQAQNILLAAGLSRTAEVYTKDAAAVLKIQVDTIAQSTKMPKAAFVSRGEAEAWLDRIS